MKKILYTLFFAVAFLITNNASAQLDPNTISPDLTITDLDGNEHNIYEYLQEGKSVILDLYAVWCGPCWNYHQAHVLEDLYKAHGPEGDNTLVVLAIETDPSTAESLIYGGPANQTIGDWTEGISYPMANHNTAADLFAQTYYPTIYYITPTMIIHESAQQPASYFEELLANQPPVPTGTNNATILSFEDKNANSREYCNTTALTVAPTLGLQNIGDADLTSLTITAKNGETVLGTQEWSGDVEPLGYFEVDITAFTFFAEGNNTEISIEISNPNGMEDDDTYNTYNLNFSHVNKTGTEMVTIEILTDQYADETYWALVDSNGEIVVDGGNPNVGLENYGTGQYPAAHPDMYASNTAYTVENVELNEWECYEFIVTDYFGDGLCCTYGDGYVRAINTDGEIIVEAGEFGGIAASGFLRGVAANSTFSADTEDLTVTFNNTTAGEDITEYAWDFGDGNTFMGENPEPHVYAEAGDYTITLTVTSAYGTTTSEETVTATEPVVETSSTVIAGMGSLEVFPQPANQNLTVAFNLENAKALNVTIINSVGQTVANLGELSYTAGSNEINVNVADLISGIYFVNFQNEGQNAYKRFTVIK